MTPDAMDELLAQAGVDLGRPERRRERAVRLCNEGMTTQDLDELVDWGHTTRRKLHTVGHWLGWATSRKDRWTAVLDDVRKLKAARAAKTPTLNAAAPGAQQDPQQQAERRRGMAVVRVLADKAEPHAVAAELGMATEEVEQLVAEELRRRAAARPAPKPAEPARRGKAATEEVW